MLVNTQALVDSREKYIYFPFGLHFNAPFLDLMSSWPPSLKLLPLLPWSYLRSVSIQ